MASSSKSRWIVALLLFALICSSLSKEINRKSSNGKKKSKTSASMKKNAGKKASTSAPSKKKSKKSKSSYSQSVETSVNGDSNFAGGYGTESAGESAAFNDQEVHMYDFLPPITITLDPSEDYLDGGVELAKKQKFEEALQKFRAASHYMSYHSGSWYNMALTIVHFVNSSPKKFSVEDKERHALICEAVYAQEIFLLLKGEEQDDFVETSLETLISKYPGGKDSCELSEESLLDKQKAEAALELALQDSQRAAASFCATVDDVRLILTPKLKSQQVLPAAFMLAYLTKMYVCGVVGISNVFDPAFIDQLQEAHSEQYDPSMFKGQPQTDDFAYRGGFRYEIRWPMELPYTDPQLTQNKHLLSLVKGALGGNQIEIDTFSHVDSMPKAGTQHWHEDVDPVHKLSQFGEARHSPPQGVVVIVPIVDVSELNGPTEFVSGSHVNLAWQKQQANQYGEKTSKLKIPSKKGDCVIFDLRTRHRGTANKSKNVRPIIYMSYVHAWYRDAVNFKGKQTREWSNQFETTAAQKLFMRADQSRYVAKLEKALVERGVDITEFQANNKYTAAQMKV